MLPCLNKKFFGFECMGCGLQRSVALLLRGEFVEAFKMYPAVYPLIFLFGFLGVNIFFKLKYSSKIIIGLSIITLAMMIGNYILKLTNH